MPHWHAKVRRRLKHVDAVVVTPAPDGGAHTFTLKKHNGVLIPISRNSHTSVAAAKRDAEAVFQIRPVDWSEEPDPPVFGVQFEAAAKKALQAYRAAGPVRPDPALMQALARKMTPAEGRRIKRLLPGTWTWRDHTLRLLSDGTWRLTFGTQLAISLFRSVDTMDGGWSYGGGLVCFLQRDRMRGFQSKVVEVSEHHLVLADFPGTLSFARQADAS